MVKKEKDSKKDKGKEKGKDDGGDKAGILKNKEGGGTPHTLIVNMSLCHLRLPLLSYRDAGDGAIRVIERDDGINEAILNDGARRQVEQGLS